MADLKSLKEAAGSLPLDDASPFIKGSVDPTKLVRIEADGITTGTTRVLTMPDQNVDLTPDTGSFLANIVGDTTPQLGGPLDANAQQVRLAKGADVASAGALTLLADGNFFDITGTTTITSIVTLGIGTKVTLQFDGILILTHNAADLILPTGSNITTAVGDTADFVEYAAGDWICVNYNRADGSALTGGSGVAAITRSQTRVHTTAGTGSTNIMIRHFTVTVEDVGTDITFASDVTNGASFTINTAGHYSVSYSGNSDTTGTRGGVSLNSAQLSTAFPSITVADRLASGGSDVASTESYWIASWSGYLEAGDVLRPHVQVNEVAAVPSEELMSVARMDEGGAAGLLADSTVRYHTSNGNGSSNTSIRRFSTEVTNTGSDITYADSASDGATFTINTTGRYAISYSDNFSSANVMLGISLNSSQLSTSPADITAADRLALNTNQGNTVSYPSVAWTGYLTAADVIRAHVSATTADSAARANFTITKLSDAAGGGGGGGGSSWTASNIDNTDDAGTATTEDKLFSDTSTAAFTYDLPATPTLGDRVMFIDNGGAWATNNLTVGRNGETINDVAGDDTLNVNNGWVVYEYSGTTWRRRTS